MEVRHLRRTRSGARGAWLLKHVRAAIHNSLFNFPFLTGIGDGQFPVLPAVSGLGAVPVTVNGTSPQVSSVTADQGTITGVGSHDQSSMVGGVRLPDAVSGVELNQDNPSQDRGSADALLKVAFGIVHPAGFLP
jgi:hypothetical protein